MVELRLRIVTAEVLVSEPWSLALAPSLPCPRLPGPGWRKALLRGEAASHRHPRLPFQLSPAVGAWGLRQVLASFLHPKSSVAGTQTSPEQELGACELAASLGGGVSTAWWV